MRDYNCRTVLLGGLCLMGLVLSSLRGPFGGSAVKSRTHENGPVKGKEQSDRQRVLDAVILDLLQNPDLEHTRSVYGTHGETLVVLLMDSPCPWPKEYKPSIRGYHFVFAADDGSKDPTKRRRLGILLYQFPSHLTETLPKGSLYEHPIAVGITNMGGSANGGAAGACEVQYSLKQTRGRWKIEYEGFEDP